MTFEVEVGGRVRTVAIERLDRRDRYRVLVDGRPHLLDVTRSSEYGLSLLVTVDGPPGESATVPFSRLPGTEKGTISRNLYVTPAGAFGELLVTLDGRMALVTVNGRRTGHAADAAAHPHGEVSITAPMPGRVVRVLVAPGAEISARQGVVVVEAMKMENELRAPRAGRVKEIAVEPGTSVEAGRVLAVIE